MFSDNEQAVKEIKCHQDSIELANACLKKYKFGYAATHLEDAARSLRELQNLKEEKKNGQVRVIGTVMGFGNVFDRW